MPEPFIVGVTILLLGGITVSCSIVNNCSQKAPDEQPKIHPQQANNHILSPSEPSRDYSKDAPSNCSKDSKLRRRLEKQAFRAKRLYKSGLNRHLPFHDIRHNIKDATDFTEESIDQLLNQFWEDYGRKPGPHDEDSLSPVPNTSRLAFHDTYSNESSSPVRNISQLSFKEKLNGSHLNQTGSNLESVDDTTIL